MLNFRGLLMGYTWSNLDDELDELLNKAFPSSIGEPKKESKLSVKEIYERNKTANFCINCGKKTEEKMVLSSIIHYCKPCCG